MERVLERVRTTSILSPDNNSVFLSLLFSLGRSRIYVGYLQVRCFFKVYLIFTVKFEKDVQV